jgi:uncharacterized protein (TIGR02594 family)
LNNNVMPDPRLSVDGVFGSKTETTVRRFQHQEGLGVDGIVGPKTWYELGDLGVDEVPQCGGVIPSWMHIALGELRRGVRENRSKTQHNPRIVEYHKTTSFKNNADEVAWCSAFVNWCIQRAGMTGTGKGNARSWTDWGRGLKTPAYGSIAVLWRESPQSWKGHVGFFLARRGPDKVLLLGGNQGNSVSIAAYPTKRVLGYRWPR